MIITLTENENFLAIGEEISSFEKSQIVVLPAPYEHRVSYGGGTSRGPEKILQASAFVEFYDDEFDRELCSEVGIATLKPIDFSEKVDSAALDEIEKRVAETLDAGKFVATLGGEHTISTAPVKAHFEKYPGMSLLHFDAHSDLRDSYEGSKYSHACFARRVAEFFPAERIIQAGVRALCAEEAEYIKTNGVKTFFASQIRKGERGENWQKAIADALGDEIYVSFDVDYFDPAIMPATGTPEPDGFLYSETLDVFREISRAGKRIVGFDVVELAPIDGLNHPDLTAARLVYKILNFAF